jgi:hypothetical protein
MDIKRKTYDIWTWKKHLFLEISSTNTDTPVPSLYQCTKTCCMLSFLTVVSANSTLLFHHLQLLNVLGRISQHSCEPLYVTNTFHSKQETFLYKYPLHWVLLPTKKKKRTTELCSSVLHTSSTVAILTTETCLWTFTCASATYTVMKLDCDAT